MTPRTLKANKPTEHLSIINNHDTILPSSIASDVSFLIIYAKNNYIITMALEPRGALRSAIMSRRESVCSEAEIIPTEPLLTTTRFHDEPDFPIHPALEYELVAAVDDDDDDDGYDLDVLSCLRQPSVVVVEEEEDGTTRRRRRIINVKLFFSFVFLVISGVGTVVSAKLQAIPM